MIRPAKPTDLPSIQNLLEVTNVAIPGLDYSRWDGLLLVAEEEGTVVGMLHGLPAKPLGIMGDMAVLPSHQRMGIGTDLLKSMELLFRTLGCLAWVAYVPEKRTVSLAALQNWPGVEMLGSGMTVLRRLT